MTGHFYGPIGCNSGYGPVYDGLTGARWCAVFSPAVPLGSSALDDGLHENTQLLQAGVSAHPHPDDTDSQAVVIWRGVKDRLWVFY